MCRTKSKDRFEAQKSRHFEADSATDKPSRVVRSSFLRIIWTSWFVYSWREGEAAEGVVEGELVLLLVLEIDQQSKTF